MNSSDSYYMQKALDLAECGRGSVSPNPVVGAVLVKNGKIISQGYHQKFGSAHAEAEVLRRAGKKAKGATLYVTLEPCSTYGKTPPCVNAIIRSRVKRVVIAAKDPNPKHNGRAITLLKKAKIQVVTHVLYEKAKMQNEAFNKWICTGIPFVTLKMAQTLDGKIATKSGESKWISGPHARNWVGKLRSQVDAILVGTQTAIKDNPRLTIRNQKSKYQPWRIVLDADLKLNSKMNLFKSGGMTILVCSHQNAAKAVKKFSQRNVFILAISVKKKHFVLKELLEKLGKLGITSLLVEGGAELAWSFLAEKLVDKVYWVIAPKFLGGKDAKTSVEGGGFSKLVNAISLKNVQTAQLGEDLLIKGYL